MTMHVIRDDAPGHDVAATETGWRCVCGVGHEWTERPRTRAVAAGKRHLAAIARGERVEAQAPAPDPLQDPDPTPEPAPWETPADAPAPQPERPARPNLVDQFRSPPRDPE